MRRWISGSIKKNFEFEVTFWLINGAVINEIDRPHRRRGWFRLIAKTSDVRSQKLPS